jgi:hypothetical protein
MEKAEHNRSDHYLVAQMRINARRAWRAQTPGVVWPAKEPGLARPTPLAPADGPLPEAASAA